jgi:hypothetical protein
MRTAPPAVFFKFNSARVVLFVLGGGIVPPFTLGARKLYDYTHF